MVSIRAIIIYKLKNVILSTAILKVRVLVSFTYIASSIDIKDWAIVDINLRYTLITTLSNIKKKDIKTIISKRCNKIGKK